ncbi:hypothetical protein [Pseudomonas rubra]|uniref:Phage protein n=1 Tax=Pseudomonas rubra TaxID=2942627 RepID=A0ABT5PF24_9PSED|nr:hypothetical protein [Pseudomonas rubra]MDD1016868.1 hypothetical protein [Pseudomonas rubra]MDD1039386.1 hypothetical protein [Pseudomonas rubra]MDD1157832.1 hypothetical protein [Pseudomonas rubra]
MSAQQQLIAVDDISEENTPAIYVAGGLKQFIEIAKAEVEGEVPDLTSRKGRERIASLAAKVSKSKTAVEKPGRDYLRRLKEMPKVVEAELRDFVTAMDNLRDQVRQPLNEWQAAEDARVDGHNNAISHLKLHAEALEGITAEDLADRIAKVEAVALGNQWEEFETEAARAKDDSLKVLRAALAARQQYEAEQAELARLRAEAEAREQKEREERIAREAAERARVAAEQKAQAEREATQRRELEAKAAADRRELELKLQAEQAERARAQAEADRVATEQRAEQERQAATRRAEEAAEQARQDERRRADAAATEILRQQETREADKAHKTKVNRAALEAFVAGGMTEECAKQAITLIALRRIPNISIQY